jgi:hypothetical protein
MAEGNLSAHKNILAELSDTLRADIPRSLGDPDKCDLRDDGGTFNVVMKRIETLEAARDWLIAHIRAGRAFCYLKSADRQWIPVPSMDFIDGMSIHCLHGTITSSLDDFDRGHEIYRRWKKQGLSSEVWIRRQELLNLLQSAATVYDVVGGPSARSQIARKRYDSLVIQATSHRPLTVDQTWVRRDRSVASRRRKIASFEARAMKSREWVALRGVADWCSRTPETIKPSSELSVEAYRQLGDALTTGEFSLDGRSRVLCLLPYPSGLWGRLTAERLGLIRGDDAAVAALLEESWAPSDLVGRWFDSRRHMRPPHLFPRESSVATVASPERSEPTNKQAETAASIRTGDTMKPPFDKKQAHALLAAKKVSRIWPNAPRERETRKFLKLHFRGVPNDPHRDVRRATWPDMKRGPKPKSGAVE